MKHHVAHAASAFYSSGFDEAAILVVDGQGSGKSTSLAHGRAGRIKVLDQYLYRGVARLLSIRH